MTRALTGYSRPFSNLGLHTLKCLYPLKPVNFVNCIKRYVAKPAERGFGSICTLTAAWPSVLRDSFAMVHILTLGNRLFAYGWKLKTSPEDCSVERRRRRVLYKVVHTQLPVNVLNVSTPFFGLNSICAGIIWEIFVVQYIHRLIASLSCIVCLVLYFKKLSTGNDHENSGRARDGKSRCRFYLVSDFAWHFWKTRYYRDKKTFWEIFVRKVANDSSILVFCLITNEVIAACEWMCC